MDNDRKRLIVYIIATLAVLSMFAAIYWSANSEPEPGDRARFVPGGWTPELIQIYNNSEAIEILEFRPFNGVSINNKYVPIDELVILMIPEGVENRVSFITQISTQTWEDENVMIGNATKSSETYTIVAYVFTDMNVSNALYDRHEEFNHPATSFNEIEVRGIDLTISPFYDVEVE